MQNQPIKMIEIEGLYKSFGDVKAVQNLSFSVNKGELFAFLGVNGAGKSTTINVLCGQIKKDAGTVKVSGVEIDRSPEQIKRQIGVVFQNSVLDGVLTANDNLQTRAALYGITGEDYRRRLKELDELLHLKPLLGRTVGKLSGGQRRKIDIARALIHSPSLLILDEPTTGLDPQTRKTIWQAVSYLQKKSGTTVLLTTHYMEEAADADYVIIIDGGKTAASGTPHTLKTEFAKDHLTLYDITEEEAAALNLPFQKTGNAFHFTISDTKAATDLIVAHPAIFRDYEITRGKMDDVFLAVTGKNLTAEVEA